MTGTGEPEYSEEKLPLPLRPPQNSTWVYVAYLVPILPMFEPVSFTFRGMGSRNTM